MTEQNKTVENEQVEQTNEVAIPQPLTTQLISESDDYKVVLVDGEYVRKAKYKEFSTFTASTRAEKVWLLNLLEGAEDSAIGLKDAVHEEIEIAHVIVQAYDTVDKKTGEVTDGVLTYLITPEQQAYVTSAKAVYFTINRILKHFGKPGDADWENVKVQVTKTKMANGDAIGIKMID